MAQGAQSNSFPLFGTTPGNPQLPVIPGPAEPKDGLESLFVDGASITARRFPQNYLEVLGAGPGVAGGFAQTWLNGLTLSPNPLDYGNITADKTLSVTIHNTFRTPCTVTAVDVSQVSGVTLDSPGLPIVIPSFSTQQFTFTATLLGDTEFDDLVTFSTDCGDLTLRMIGRRVIIFGVFPQKSILERVSFLTDTMISRDGTEQSMSLRVAPRSGIQLQLRHVDIVEKGIATNLQLGAQHLPFGVQLWWQSREITSAALDVDNAIQVDTNYMEFSAGDNLSLVLPDRSSFEVEVLSFNATSITLTQPLGTALPLGTSVMPLRFGFMSSKSSVADFATAVQDQRITFDLFDYENIGAIDPLYFETHPVDGLPIHSTPLFFSGQSRKGAIVSNQSRLDGQTGAARQTRSEALSRPGQSVIVHINSLQDQHAWRQFLHFVRGSWGAFYVPTGSRDLPLFADFSLGGNVFDVPQMGIATLIGNVAPRRDVRITIAGVHYYRRITSAVDNVNFETITLDSVIPGAGTVADADFYCSWLTLSRMVGDTATFKHNRRGNAELRFSVRGVIDGV